MVLIGLASLLAGCQTLGAGLVRPELPALDERVLRPCYRGDAKLGDDAIVAARRKENARACEAGRRAALAAFYADLRQRLGGAR